MSRLRALSLGAGVQSTTVLLLALDGVIPDPYEAIVFADTHDEPKAVYDHLARLHLEVGRQRARWGDIRPVTDIATVSAGKLSDAVTSTFVPIPLYDGKGGMGRRQCTYQFKLRPIRTHLRTYGRDVDLSVCISTDEYLRAKDSGLKWCRNVFPLLNLGWSRKDCEEYLADRWAWPVPRSACVYCPLKSNREWLEMRETAPDDWAAAVAFDEAARPFGYVHRSERPLAIASLRPEDDGQLALECEGMCGV
jgi:3'-phosphoadenosine 5'-phosphosulfate sulfotransferase (PAPS reductase)/FAD synthetase